MGKKYHIDINGKPAECKAVRLCPKGNENQHFDTLEKAQDYADTLNERNTLLEEYKEKPSLRAKIKLKKMNEQLGLRALDGIKSPEEEAEDKRKLEEREKQREEENKKFQENYQKFIDSETLELPEKMLLNDVQKNGYYNKYKILDKAVRGENENATETNNTGTALWGLGRYTTTNRSYAKKFGKVRSAEADELPSNPLVLKNEMSAQYLEQTLCEKYNIRKSDLYTKTDLGNIIKKMGYDGLAFGPKNDMVIVKYYD